MTTTTPNVSELLPVRDPEFIADPYPYYARLRAEHPVLRVEEGLYLVSRYADVASLLRSPSLGMNDMDFGVSEPVKHSALSHFRWWCGFRASHDGAWLMRKCWSGCCSRGCRRW
ncbi:hypothetical protein ACFQ36_00180 [Arthrobacter sp. GCM10027362]|uniref:hypothetical protein n=1 Tax=Arthrobacter sp. GCM10027362 TaxID=3273379 RepID=UPI00362FCB77